MVEVNCGTEISEGRGPRCGPAAVSAQGRLRSDGSTLDALTVAKAVSAGPPPEPGGVRSLMRAAQRALPAIPGAMVSFLPIGICPVCWPVYAGLLSSLGLGFLLQTTYLLPLTVVFLALAVAGLGYRAKTRRGVGPLALGLAASLMIVVGKFAAAIDPVAYLGIGLLIGAGVWNAWPKRVGNDSCPDCVANSNP